jgi:hypothetical protein
METGGPATEHHRRDPAAYLPVRGRRTIQRRPNNNGSGSSAADNSITTSSGPFAAIIVQRVSSSPVKSSGRAIRPAIHSAILA